jgi:hypothetical protein
MDPANRPPRPVPTEADRPDAAPFQEDDPDKRGKKKPAPPDKPGAGRMTPLGRRMETPASIKTAGPSGQRGRTQHQKKHTNK